ncbi:MAG TPA: hypothetical protein VF293_05775 [Candidatus Limnocylindrales bacterium]
MALPAGVLIGPVVDVAWPGIRTEKPSPCGASVAQAELSTDAAGEPPACWPLAVAGGAVGGSVGVNTAGWRGIEEEQALSRTAAKNMTARRRNVFLPFLRLQYRAGSASSRQPWVLCSAGTPFY